MYLHGWWSLDGCVHGAYKIQVEINRSRDKLRYKLSYIENLVDKNIYIYIAVIKYDI